MAMFQDTMDNTRIVKTLRHEGKTTICAVYWKDNGRLNYGGTAPIPTSLFDDNLLNKRIGFVPVRDA